MYRSPLNLRHEAMGANWTERFGSPIVSDYGESVEQCQQAFRRLAVIDLSPLPRLGIKGADLSRWNHANGYSIGDAPNIGYPQGDGRIACRLSASEVLVLANVNAVSVVEVKCIVEDYRCYTIRRQDSHIWFAVTGQHGAAMFAKICGVDLSAQKFPDLSLAQTSVARVSALILRHNVAENPVYHLFADSSYACYLWDCLLDAAAEFNGQTLGLQAFHESVPD